jgi:hypothetical protein
MMQPIITIRDLSKRYRLGRSESAYKTFRETLVDAPRLAIRSVVSLLGGWGSDHSKREMGPRRSVQKMVGCRDDRARCQRNFEPVACGNYQIHWPEIKEHTFRENRCLKNHINWDA